MSPQERVDAKARADAWAVRLRALLAKGATPEEMDALWADAGK